MIITKMCIKLRLQLLASAPTCSNRVNKHRWAIRTIGLRVHCTGGGGRTVTRQDRKAETGATGRYQGIVSGMCPLEDSRPLMITCASELCSGLHFPNVISSSRIRSERAAQDERFDTGS